MSGILDESPQNNAQRTRARPRPVVRRVVPDQEQTDALEALRRRRDAALAAKVENTETAAPVTMDTSAKKAVTARTVARTTHVLSPARRSVRRAPADSSPRQAAAEARAPRTPERERDTDTPDLYGLSPRGEISQANLQAQLKAGRGDTQRKPQSALKAQGTPAVESSILALQNFRRRPRQPSILRMIQQNDDGKDDEDLDDFNPDDESTPFNVKKRKSEDAEGSRSDVATPEAAGTLSAKKPKPSSPDVQVPRSSPPLANAPISVHDSSDSDSSSDLSSLPEQDEATQEDHDHGGADTAHEAWSDTMAPPKSSSSLVDGEDSHAVKSVEKPSKPLANRRGRSAKAHQPNSDEPSDADETTPTRPIKSTAPSKQSKPPSLSTAALQSLLPQRRRRAKPAQRDEFDITSSDTDALTGDSDADELQLPPARRGTAAARRGAARTPVKAPAKPGVAATTSGKKGRTAAAGRKTVSPISARKTKTTPASGGARTYARRGALSDKENGVVGVSSGESESEATETEDGADAKGRERAAKGKERDEGFKSAELKKAAEKFAEVDEWEMEFESVDAAGMSSPWR